MLLMANRYFFVLNNDLTLNFEELKKTLGSIKKGDSVCLFGFTWIIYKLLADMPKQKISGLNSLLKHTTNDRILLHIGGWKKMADLNVTKGDFSDLVAKRFAMKTNKITDIYGFTE